MHFFNVLFWRIGGGGWDEEQPRVDLNYNLNSLFQNDQNMRRNALSYRSVLNLFICHFT